MSVRLSDLPARIRKELRESGELPPAKQATRARKTASESREPQSEGEWALLGQIRRLGLAEPQPQFHVKGIRGDFDFGWDDRNLLVEIQGGAGTSYMGHTSVKGYADDCVKMAKALLAGYRVQYFTTAMVEDGRAGALLEQLLGR